MGTVTLVTGGARSGKSSYAEDYITKKCSSVAYIATAQVLDDEMQLRVDKHQKRRPTVWQTYEEPLMPYRVIAENGHRFDGILLDCLTIYTANLLLQDTSIDWQKPGADTLKQVEQKVLSEVELLLDAAHQYNGHFVAVTNEVGLGTIPEDALSRFFRDCCGIMNSTIASVADSVFFVVSGIPMQLKGK